MAWQLDLNEDRGSSSMLCKFSLLETVGAAKLVKNMSSANYDYNRSKSLTDYDNVWPLTCSKCKTGGIRKDHGVCYSMASHFCYCLELSFHR